jgi:hypothetical protein
VITRSALCIKESGIERGFAALLVESLWLSNWSVPDHRVRLSLTREYRLVSIGKPEAYRKECGKAAFNVLSCSFCERLLFMALEREFDEDLEQTWKRKP